MSVTASAAKLVIDLNAVAHNLSLVRARAPNSRVMAILKANAYGHGAIQVASCLMDADSFGVSRLEEALELRGVGIDKPIVLLEGIMDQDQLALASDAALDLVVHSRYQIELLRRSGFTGGVWVKVNTGMNRLGFGIDDVAGALKDLGACRVIGIMTHLADAESDEAGTQRQISSLREGTRKFGLPLSIANSAGILQHPESHADWVRPGLMLYGVPPVSSMAGDDDLHQAMTLSAPVIAINTIHAGASVGYGGRWTASRDTRIGVLAIGYGDGYPREISSKGCVLVAGRRCPIVGRVSMDMTCIVVDGDVAIGERATLWGEHLPVSEIALASDTIAYTLMCQMGERVQREYVHSVDPGHSAGSD